jgi:serine/threonine protein kinase
MSNSSGVSSMKGILPPGAQLNGIYQIDAFISSGGMGEIYRGHEILTGSPVAIKVIRDELSGDETALAMFRNEATALNRLHHEAIVRYFLFSLDPTLMRHYLAMEFVEGMSLSEILQTGPLSVEHTDALMRRLALGLQAAHNQNVIHRDVTPDNIIIPAAGIGAARIIDFGIARSTRIGDTTVISGGFAGKFNYVSPEQLGMFDGDVRAASDIYSLGLVLVQCLLGRALDMGGSEYEVIEKRRLVPNLADIDARMRPLIEHMLQPNPADRPASMAEISAWKLPIDSAQEQTVFIAAAARGSISAPPAPLQPAKAAAPSTSDLFQTKSPKPRTPWGAWSIVAPVGAVLLGVVAYMAWQHFATPGKGVVEGGAQEKAAIQSRPPPAQDPIARIRQSVRTFDGGDCFLALPGAISTDNAEIDGFGLAKERFEALDAAFKTANGFEAQVNVREVTTEQCPTLPFVRRFAFSGDGVRLDVMKVRLHRLGDVLQGVVETRYAHVKLLLVDDEGLVHDLSEQVNNSGDRRDFAMRLQTQRPSPLLLVAIAGNQPISAGSTSQEWQAKDFFPAIVRAMSDFAQTPSVALKYIKME